MLLNPRVLLIIAALLGALSVAVGAFGAHALRGSLSAAEMATFETATRYLSLHAVAIFAVAMLAELRGWPGLNASGLGLTLGVGVFCTSLYILCLTDVRWIAWLTPLGGLTLIAAWLSLAWAIFRQLR